MTDKVIIDYTQCKYNTFDGGGSQRTICSLDGKYCDCLRDKECYYKQLQRKTQECEKMKEENEELEKLLTKEPMALQALRAGYTAYKTDTKVFSNLLERYKSALDEFLDIITKEKEQE